jgi:WhiB family transcriptional regulator, redox-sensing transcriptional regulator
MAIAEVLTGSYSDDATITRFYVLLANLRPTWHAQAACRGQGPDRWFPPPHEQPTTDAVELCGGCPVRLERADAGHGERSGWWGGLSPRDRVRLRRAVAVPA